MPLKWYHLHIWGCWYFSPQSQFQLVLYSLTFRMMYPAHQLNKQGDNIHPFPILNQFIFSCPVLTVASWPANRFLKEAGNVVWYSHLIKNILQFVVIHTVKGSSIISEAEVDFFLLEFPCFFYDPVDAGNLISGSSAFSKSSFYIWKFSVHKLLKPRLVYSKGFPDSSVGKESTWNAGDPSSFPGLGRSAGGAIGYPLQYSWASLVAQLVKNPPATWET